MVQREVKSEVAWDDSQLIIEHLSEGELDCCQVASSSGAEGAAARMEAQPSSCGTPNNRLQPSSDSPCSRNAASTKAADRAGGKCKHHASASSIRLLTPFDRPGLHIPMASKGSIDMLSPFPQVDAVDAETPVYGSVVADVVVNQSRLKEEPVAKISWPLPLPGCSAPPIKLSPRGLSATAGPAGLPSGATVGGLTPGPNSCGDVGDRRRVSGTGLQRRSSLVLVGSLVIQPQSQNLQQPPLTAATGASPAGTHHAVADLQASDMCTTPLPGNSAGSSGAGDLCPALAEELSFGLAARSPSPAPASSARLQDSLPTSSRESSSSRNSDSSCSIVLDQCSEASDAAGPRGCVRQVKDVGAMEMQHQEHRPVQQEQQERTPVQKQKQQLEQPWEQQLEPTLQPRRTQGASSTDNELHTSSEADLAAREHLNSEPPGDPATASYQSTAIASQVLTRTGILQQLQQLLLKAAEQSLQQLQPAHGAPSALSRPSVPSARQGSKQQQQQQQRRTEREERQSGRLHVDSLAVPERGQPCVGWDTLVHPGSKVLFHTGGQSIQSQAGSASGRLQLPALLAPGPAVGLAAPGTSALLPFSEAGAATQTPGGQLSGLGTQLLSGPWHLAQLPHPHPLQQQPPLLNDLLPRLVTVPRQRAVSGDEADGSRGGLQEGGLFSGFLHEAPSSAQGTPTLMGRTGASCGAGVGSRHSGGERSGLEPAAAVLEERDIAALEDSALGAPSSPAWTGTVASQVEAEADPHDLALPLLVREPSLRFLPEIEPLQAPVPLGPFDPPDVQTANITTLGGEAAKLHRGDSKAASTVPAPAMQQCRGRVATWSPSNEEEVRSWKKSRVS